VILVSGYGLLHDDTADAGLAADDVRSVGTRTVSAQRRVLQFLGWAAPRVAPLRVRKIVARLADKLPSVRRERLILALLEDWASEAPADYHRFLWSNHLSYARFYDPTQIDIGGTLNPLRLELLELACTDLRSNGVDPGTDVRSFADIGCSLGYLPRYAETTTFPSAARILGIDIDEAALAAGRSYLRSVGSQVELRSADIADLGVELGDEMFDVITSTGVLQYIEEDQAARAVVDILQHTVHLFCVSGPAAPDMDNAELERSHVRAYDRSWIHNFDRMIERAGGRVVARRWGGEKLVLENSIYLVVAAPARRLRGCV
jgi:SAM-dependent methyltransferase